MEFLGVEINESTSLNTSLVQPAVPEPEVVVNNNTSQAHPEPETQNTSVQNNQNLPHYISQCEGGSLAAKSNYSSINNILPCPDSEHNRSRREEVVQRPGEKSQFANSLPPSSSLNPDLMAIRQKIGLESHQQTVSDKLPVRTTSRPPLNPNEVAKGLTALHSKVDEILRKKSQPRGRDTSFESERPQRAVSSDARSETKAAQPLTLNSSYYKEAATPDILSGRTCHSIDVGGFSGLSGLLAQAEDCRDVIAHLKNLKAQAQNQNQTQSNTSQDLSLKEKSISNPVKTNGSPKSKFHVTAKLPSYTQAVKPNIAIEALKYNSSHMSQRATEESFHSQENKSKPKYDEKKLESIISRIRERNSVSPGRGPRGSAYESEARNAPRFSIASQANSLNATKKLPDLSTLHKDIKLDERNNTSMSWHLTTLPKEDKSIEEIPEKESNMNTITGNTTILELFDKKRSLSSPKFRDFNTEEDKRSLLRLNRVPAPTNETQLYASRPLHTVSDKSHYDTSSLGSSGKYNVQDLIKELKNRKPTNFNSEQRRAAETVRVADEFLERSRNLFSFNGTLKAGELALQLGTYQNGYNPQAIQENVNKREREMAAADVLSSQKDPANFGFGGLENDMDSLWETNKETGAQNKLQQNHEIENKRVHTETSQGHYIGSSRGREMQTHSRKKSGDKTEKINRIIQESACHFDKQDLIAKLNFEKEKQQNRFDKVERNMLEEQSPIKRIDDDSLMMDDSVFSIREGGAMIGEINTNRLFNNTESQDKLSKKPKVCNRTELCNTDIRKKYLQDDQDISDFDFDRNKLEPTERDLNDNTSRFKLRFDKLEMNQESHSAAKRQKVEDKRPSSIGYSSEKKVPKTEMPRRGIIGRGPY